MQDQTLIQAPHLLVAAGRWDIYGPIHKGLRLGHGEMLRRLGRADFGADQRELLADLRTHLDLAAKHLHHEETHIHPALEARVPGGARRLEDDHDEHRARLAGLTAMIRDAEAASSSLREGFGRALYLGFARFVADDFAHMDEEESTVWPLLCAVFGDEELFALEMAIVSSLSPEENTAFMRLMLPAMTPAERAGLLRGVKASAPPEAYAAVVELAARPSLPAADFAELERLGLAA